MYPLGFLPFFCSLVPEWGAVAAALALPLLVLALWFYYAIVVARSPPSSSSSGYDGVDDAAPVHLPGSALAHILPFFHRRFDFINEGFQLAGQAIYQFSLLRVRVPPSLRFVSCACACALFWPVARATRCSV